MSVSKSGRLEELEAEFFQLNKKILDARDELELLEGQYNDLRWEILEYDRRENYR